MHQEDIYTIGERAFNTLCEIDDCHKRRREAAHRGRGSRHVSDATLAWMYASPSKISKPSGGVHNARPNTPGSDPGN